MDSVLIAYCSILPTLIVLILGGDLLKSKPWIITWYWVIWICSIVYCELATISFMAEFDSRPNRLFLEYLVHPKEVLSTIWADYKYMVIFSTVLMIFTIRYGLKLIRLIVVKHHTWSLKWRSILLLPCIVVLFLGARGTLAHRPVNISSAAFSNDRLVNQMALNSTYTVLYALYSLRHEKDPSKVYGKMDTKKMIDLVRSHTQHASDAWISDSIPFLHVPSYTTVNPKPPNLVIILEESLGAEFVGCLGGLPLTPHFDKLSKEGLLLTQLYSTGTRTVRGIESVMSGFLPTPGRSVVKLGNAQDHFFSLATLLKNKGYITEFIYGGESHFDNMRTFFQGNGVSYIYDETYFKNPSFHGIWGVSDEDLFDEADKILDSHGDKPFFSFILSTSNHTPFEFPEGKIEPYEQPLATRNNAMKYADYAIGHFFDLAKDSDYYSNTIFIVIADHNTRTYGNNLVPIHKFHIPALIIGPGVPHQHYDAVCSQIDIGPTLLDLMGINDEHPMIGNSVLRNPPDFPGRAIMQFAETNAYLSGDQVVIQQPHAAPLQFTYTNEQLEAHALDPDLVDTAKAHALIPGYLYNNRLHTLKKK